MVTKLKKNKKRSKKSAAANATGPGPTDQHTPIIITDGSASIEFSSGEYPKTTGSDIRQSKNLRLDRIVANKKHNNGMFTCHQLAANERVVIRVTCKINGTDDGKNFTITGGNSTLAGNSPSIEFSDGVYSTPFPPIEQGKRVGNVNREITKLEIFRVNQAGNLESVHNCEVIAKKNFKIRVRDPHTH